MDYEKYMMAIPIVPEVATKIMQINEDNDSLSFADLTHLISLDPYLSASILKIANSALYSRRNEIKELDTAVNMIGFKKIKTMVLLLAGASLFKKNDNSQFYQLYWSQSIISAFICRDMVSLIDIDSSEDEIFTASLLHRIGEVPLFLSNPKRYMALIHKFEKGQYTLSSEELNEFKVNYCLIGSELLNYWDFPEDLISTARNACLHDLSYSHKMIDAIRLGDWLTIKLGFGIPEFLNDENVAELLQRTGLSQNNYDYFISEAYLEKLKNSSFFKECQSTLNVKL